MGRQKGTPNKDKHRLLRALQEIHPDYNPLTELLKIAHKTDSTTSERLMCHKEIAQYVFPKLKAIEHSGELEHSVVYKPVLKRFDGTIDDADI